MPTIYRAMIDQPSRIQPLHKYHGMKGIAVESKDTCQMWFTEGEIISMEVPKLCLTKLNKPYQRVITN
jgi:hypothetical protein